MSDRIHVLVQYCLSHGWNCGLVTFSITIVTHFDKLFTDRPLTVRKLSHLEFCSGEESVPSPISSRPNLSKKGKVGLVKKVTQFPTEIRNANKSNTTITVIT